MVTAKRKIPTKKLAAKKLPAKKVVVKKIHSYNALSFRQRGNAGPALVVFSAPVADIQQFSHVAHLGDARGPQRDEKVARVQAIRKFLAIDPQNTIPTALILAFKGKRATFNAAAGDAGKLSISSGVESATVVDGQHRLLGIHAFDPKMKIPVIGILEASDVESAFQFLVVNNKASKVPATHTKALLAKMKETDLVKRLRNARLAFDAEGINDVDLVNSDPESPFFQTIDWTTTPAARRMVQATSIELSLDYMANIGLQDFEDRDIRRSVFLSIWKTVKLALPTLWIKDSRLVSKVGIICLTRFIVDRISNWADSDELDIEVTDLEQIEEQTRKILGYMDSRFWTAKWAENSKGGFDTSQGRDRVLAAITTLYRNGRREITWYTDIEIIERTATKK